MNTNEVKKPVGQPVHYFDRDEMETGLRPAKLHATFPHRLGVKIPLERPKYALAIGQRAPTAALPGAMVYLTVYPLSAHPEHPEFLQWVCRSPHCAGKHWATKEELVAAHPSQDTLRRNGEYHVYHAVLEVPAEGPRPGSVHLLTEDA